MEAKAAEPTLSTTSHLRVEEDNRQEAEDTMIVLITIKILAVVEVEVALALLKAQAILAGILPVTLHKTKIQLIAFRTDEEVVVGAEEQISLSNRALREAEDAAVLQPLRVLPGTTKLPLLLPRTKTLLRTLFRRQLPILGELNSPKGR